VKEGGGKKKKKNFEHANSLNLVFLQINGEKKGKENIRGVRSN